MSTPYLKIDSLFKRDMSNNGKLILGDWATPEFEFLQNNKWVWTEKIDGTNIRINFDPENNELSFGGRTDRAILPKHLLEHLQKTFTLDKMNALNMDWASTIYGEGYGIKIQSAGKHYITNGVGFILFDVRVGKWWLNRGACEDIASELGIKIVPIVGMGSLYDAIQFVSDGFTSLISEDRSFGAEGIIAKCDPELFARSGQRIITKIKTIDFKK